MSIVSVNRIASELDLDEEGYRTYRSTWEVITSSASDGPLTVLAASGLPAIGSGYSWTDGSDSAAIRLPTTSIKMRSEGQRKIWRVGITHSTKTKNCLTSAPTNPLAAPIKIRGSWVPKTKIATEDRHGAPLLNTALEPITPGLETDDDQDTVIIEVNTATLSLATRAAYKNKVNSKTIWGLAPRCVKIKRWDYELLYYGSCSKYFKNVLEFCINEDGWDARVLDQGFREYLGDDSEDGSPIFSTIVSDKDRGPLNHQTPLNGNGLRLPDGDPYEFLEFEVADEIDFTSLGLPNPLW